MGEAAEGGEEVGREIARYSFCDRLRILPHSPMLPRHIPHLLLTMRHLCFLALSLMLMLTTGCATPPPSPPPVVPPVAELPKVKLPPRVKPAPALPSPPKATPPVTPAPLSDQQIYNIVLKLLPSTLQDKAGWATDLQMSFKHLQILPTTAHFCAVIAVIAQESNFQADPAVPNLPSIVQREIAQRSEKYGIPKKVVDWTLDTDSRDGRTYQKRIATLKTEKELSDLIDEVMDRFPMGKKLLGNYNPVRTGGPMQVSVEFADGQVKERPYPYVMLGSVRNEVFSRRGGLYFGSAILLDYPAPYSDILYRFADFNAGRYSSRNAAFQQALARISGQTVSTDGDLLRYANGKPAPEVSSTLRILLSIRSLLNLNAAEIQRDVQLEKSPSFSKTPLYLRVFALADQKGAQPRTVMPAIDLKSPKFKRKLTTEWFATRVNNRYKACLQQGGSTDHR